MSMYDFQRPTSRCLGPNPLLSSSLRAPFINTLSHTIPIYKIHLHDVHLSYKHISPFPQCLSALDSAAPTIPKSIIKFVCKGLPRSLVITSCFRTVIY